MTENILCIFWLIALFICYINRNHEKYHDTFFLAAIIIFIGGPGIILFYQDKVKTDKKEQYLKEYEKLYGSQEAQLRRLEIELEINSNKNKSSTIIIPIKT